MAIQLKQYSVQCIWSKFWTCIFKI